MLWLHSQNSHQKNLNNNPSTSALARLCTSCLNANGKWKSNMELMGQQKVLIGYNVARTTKKDVAFGSTAGFYVMWAGVVHCSLSIHFDTWPTELTGVRCSVELGARSGGVRDACALLLSFPRFSVVWFVSIVSSTSAENHKYGSSNLAIIRAESVERCLDLDHRVALLGFKPNHLLVKNPPLLWRKNLGGEGPYSF